jgi:hypothetical protein
VTTSSEFGNEGEEEVRCGGAEGGELRFQRVRQGHQLIHFGHDRALFGKHSAIKRKMIGPALA